MTPWCPCTRYLCKLTKCIVMIINDDEVSKTWKDLCSKQLKEVWTLAFEGCCPSLCQIKTLYAICTWLLMNTHFEANAWYIRNRYFCELLVCLNVWPSNCVNIRKPNLLDLLSFYFSFVNVPRQLQGDWQTQPKGRGNYRRKQCYHGLLQEPNPYKVCLQR